MGLFSLGILSRPTRTTRTVSTLNLSVIEEFATYRNPLQDELSTEWGNPFAANPNSLSPGEGCEMFDCAANDAACYSTPAHKKVFGCPQPVTLTADLCQ